MSLAMPPAATISPTRWVAHLIEHVPIALAGTDPEGVHQVRVAAGRLAVWLELAGQRTLRDDVRWLRSSLGPLRDLDVLRARGGDDSPWRQRALNDHPRRRAAVVEVLRARRLEGLVVGFGVLPPLGAGPARAGLARLHRRVARAGRRIARHDAPSLAALHRLRRRLRKLRFAYEWLGEKRAELTALSHLLGELNDLATEQRELAAASEGAPLDGESARLARAIDDRRAAAVASWERTRHEIEEP
jgi:CHAD domain-containing protein